MTEPHHFVFIDPIELTETRERLRAGDPALTLALAALVAEADAAATLSIGTVMDKDGIAPSGNKHDFWAIGAYSWPNPESADGLPYVYRDSRYNPEAYDSREYDKGEYSRMVSAVRTLALAWFFTHDARYALRAGELLRAWFVEPSTRMNPHFRHAAARPGVFDGHHSGVIEGAILIEMLDYVALLDDAPAWSLEDRTALRRWFRELSEWYAHSAFGRAEAATTNNHSSYYLAQVMTFAMYGGDHKRARAVVRLARRQLRTQIDPDGTLPREIARPNTFYYAVYGLRVFVVLARLGDRYDADLWGFRDRGRYAPVIPRALAWLAPFCSGHTEWTLPRYDSGIPSDALPMYRIAARRYRSVVVHRVLEHLATQERTDHARLLYPPTLTPDDADAGLFATIATGRTRAPEGKLRRLFFKVRSALILMRLLPEGRLP